MYAINVKGLTKTGTYDSSHYNTGQQYQEK